MLSVETSANTITIQKIDETFESWTKADIDARGELTVRDEIAAATRTASPRIHLIYQDNNNILPLIGVIVGLNLVEANEARGI